MKAQTEIQNPVNLFPYTDLGNALRYCELFDDKYKYIPEAKEWYHWNSKRWESDTTGAIVRNFTQVLDDIEQDRIIFHQWMKTGLLSSDEYDDLIKENGKWHKSSQSAGKINSAIRLACSQEGISRSLVDFDNKGHYLGVDNGVLNLRTGELIVDQPEYFITKSAGAAYCPEAECPNWLELLNTIFHGSEETVKFIQRIFGQSLLGTADKDKLIIMCGNGANGKSTITDTMIDLLGDYALNTSANAIIQSKANKDYYLAELKAIRLSIINESKKGAYLDEELVKSLVDSGQIQARKIYQAPITFQPVATPILTTNYRPRISADYSINRRILFVPFNYQIPEEERDPNFRTNVLLPELSGILNWALEGCSDYQQQGLNPPKSILEATAEYFRENDRIGRFIEESMVEASNSREKLKDVQAAYTDWAIANGYREVSSDRVSSELRQKGYDVEKRNGGLYHVLGLRFKTDEDKRREDDVRQFVDMS